jgi:hypothetical protein
LYKIGSEGRWKEKWRLEGNGILAERQEMESLLPGWKTGWRTEERFAAAMEGWLKDTRRLAVQGWRAGWRTQDERFPAGIEDWLKDRRWKAFYRGGRLAEGQKMEGLLQGRKVKGQKKACCRDGKLGRTEEGLLQGWKAGWRTEERFQAGIKDRLKDRRWKACHRDGRLAEGQKMEGLLQGRKVGWRTEDGRLAEGQKMKGLLQGWKTGWRTEEGLRQRWKTGWGITDTWKGGISVKRKEEDYQEYRKRLKGWGKKAERFLYGRKQHSNVYSI